jgi:hypothetical protein
VAELMAQGIETPRANQVARDVVPIVGDCHLQPLGQHLRDGTDYKGRPIAPPLEEAPPATDPNGGKRPSASARRMAAGVPPTVPTADIGEHDQAAWHRRLDADLTGTVPTGDIGTPDSRVPPGGTTSRGSPGVSGPGKR